MYQQRPPFPSPPPPRPPKTWWQRNRFGTLLIGGILLIIIVGGVAAYSLAHRLTTSMNESMNNVFEATESSGDARNDDNYENLYALCSADSSRYAEISAHLHELKQSTDAMAAEIKALRQAYKDTLQKTDPGLFTGVEVSAAFFIRSGKAKRLRKSIEAYSEKAAALCDQSIDVFEQENYYTLPVKTNELDRGYKTWESRNFSNQPIAIRATFSALLSELREFETNRLAALQQVIKMKQQGEDGRDSLGHE